MKKEAAIGGIDAMLLDGKKLGDISRTLQISKSNLSRYLNNLISPSHDVADRILQHVRSENIIERVLKERLIIRMEIQGNPVELSNLLLYPRILHLCMYELLVKEPLPNVNVVLSVETEGLVYGWTVARMLNLPFMFVRKQKPLVNSFVEVDMWNRGGGKQSFYLQKSKQFKPKKLKALFVDDVVRSGATINTIEHLVVEESGGELIKGLVIIKFREYNAKVPILSLLEY